MMSTLVAACGQSANNPPAGKSDVPAAAQVANYEGADREQKLVEAAKKEGSITLYTSIAGKDTEKLVEAFEKKYGIKVNVWRAGTDKVLQRIVSETKGGKFEYDVVHISAPEMEALHREKLLQEVKSPYLKDLIPEAIPNHKEWTATLLSVFVQAYNTNKVKKEELPKTYQDLLDPKWKGRLGIEQEDVDYFAEIVKAMGEEQGLKLWKDLVTANGISVRKGHSLLNNMVVSGEVPLGLTVYNYMPEQAKQKGAPVDWFVIEPAIARANGVGVSKQAPHPNAAVLFYDFMINDAQNLLVELNYVPTSKKAQSPMKDMKLKLVDPALILDENDKWTKLFDEIIVKQASKK
ncbi:ABC transporter substrate-binding protein [Effusibacillus lacus]|uniref:ABC transporter substrate-binding protein n=1 Tax=Effusibacillus lacus TaxID=1348429 RepID=A0A292YJR1_9BACL|nr:ABC transporter substrate-binding protein [Effusibacillus lacus]